MTPFSADIPGNLEKVYTVSIEQFDEFESVKTDLINLDGVEDVTFNNEVSPAEITLFTSEDIADTTVQQVVSQHGFSAFPKTYLIS